MIIRKAFQVLVVKTVKTQQNLKTNGFVKMKREVEIRSTCIDWICS